MAAAEAIRQRVRRIEVRIRVGRDLMAGSDDPLFLGLRGPSGREFRLRLAHGKSLRRGAEDRFVLAPAGDADVNVEHPQMNDPTAPALDAVGIASAYLRKGQEPIPNVRALGEMDDRLEVVSAEVLVYADGRAAPLRFAREGPIWLGLVGGLIWEIPPADGP